MSGKYLSENSPTESLIDKDIVLCRGAGEDFKATFGTLINDLKVELIRPILESQIGHIIININPAYKNLLLWNDGYFEYALANGGEIDASVYPILASIYGSNLPNFQDGTIRNIVSGDTRALGSFQEDDLKAHVHGMEHTHPYQDDELYQHDGIFGGGGDRTQKVEDKTTGDSSKPNTDSTGGSETRMKNIAVQFYVKARVLI